MTYLNPLNLPHDGPLKRRPLRAKDASIPGFSEQYDWHTLAYDVIHKASEKAVVCVCPKLLNFRQQVRTGQIRIDGALCPRPTIRTFRRFDEIWIPYTGPSPSQIELTLSGLALTGKISAQSSDLTDRNVVITKSKNNALAWIADWAAHYSRNQGANGFLFFDNASTDYEPDQITQTLSQAAPDAAVQVLSADFPFGPTLPKVPKHMNKFFQAAILNVARHRFVHSAAAVISVDIDEIIVGKGQTVFQDRRLEELVHVLGDF
ncbi:MAG: hypothetical protein AAFV38_08855, partial [Pseudomonadota bacterium]